MPYCQLTPGQERGSVVLYTPICGPGWCVRASYDRRSGLVTFYGEKNSQRLVFRPSVHLKASEAGIPRQTVTYSVELALQLVDTCDEFFRDTSNEGVPPSTQSSYRGVHTVAEEEGVLSGIPAVSEKHAVSRCSLSVKDHLTSAERGSTSSTDYCATTPWHVGPLGKIVEDKCKLECPISGHSETSCTQSFTVPLRDFHISRHGLETLSARRSDDGRPVLAWRIRIETKRFLSLDLRLAALRESETNTAIANHRLLSIRCKRCRHEIERVEEATLVPLPTEFFSSATGSTFCEECEPQLAVKSPALAHAGHLVYHGEDCVTLFRPLVGATDAGDVLCGHCACKLGRFVDCKRQFVSYRKSSISAFIDDSPDDIFWRHTPEREAIEYLQYDKRVKLYIVGDEALSCGGPVAEGSLFSESRPASHCTGIELIKVTSAPDAFVAVNDTVLEASRVLWRRVTLPANAQQLNWSTGPFEHLAHILVYFAQEADPTTGYTPSLLVAL
ncbi:aspartate aminotransferase family protein [Babesia caballi]|uniref:Aspartate aminotransferase family protein n=1 Tax=Babesia caballi TaxID=5871 RepID=A0AAV4LYB8_BABCB|nr:aspartate aminotransferase family protein [Babesia caballi]